MSGLNPVWRMGLLILAVLVVSTLVVAVLRRAKPQKNFSELAARVKAWWIMAAVFFGAIAVNERFSLVFFGFLSFWALKEYMTLLKTRPADHRALVWAFLAVPVQYVWVAMKWYGGETALYVCSVLFVVSGVSWFGMDSRTPIIPEVPPAASGGVTP